MPNTLAELDNQRIGRIASPEGALSLRPNRTYRDRKWGSTLFFI
jgi:hypothetical protein